MKSEQPATILHRFLWGLSVLSLDAPLVAVSWQALIAKVTHTDLPISRHIILFLVTWLAYVADRWLDSRRFDAEKTISLRHRFTSQFSKSMLNVWIRVAGFVGITVLLVLSMQELISGVFLVCVVGIYFLAVQKLPQFFRSTIPRELAVSVFFAIATGFFIWHFLPENNVLFFPAMTWYLLLCLLNCVGISIWERDADVAVDEVSIATQMPNLNESYLWFAMGLALTAGSQLFSGGDAIRPVIIATILGSGCLLLVHKSRVPNRLKSPLADLAIVVPALICVFL